MQSSDGGGARKGMMSEEVELALACNTVMNAQFFSLIFLQF